MERNRVPVGELAAEVRTGLIPLGTTFAWFSLVPLADDDTRQYLEEPIAALPPLLIAALGRVEIILAPYLEKGNGKSGDVVVYEAPAEARQIFSARVDSTAGATLAFGVKDEEIADYHYTFYSAIAGLVASEEKSEAQERYRRTLREELAAEVHGEVDERSWHLKQALLRRSATIRKETRHFRDYARQSFEDTLTLYLHGICCDIDVETGPRQMPSRYLRRRLEMLSAVFPPPEGYAVLPESGKKR
ncbi:MAG: hypothetical protein ACRD96_14525 [Bryobacteraceae bacterium]